MASQSAIPSRSAKKSRVTSEQLLVILAEHAAHPSNYFAIHCKGCLWSAVDHVLKLDAYSGQAMKFLENVAPQDAAIAYAEVSTALDNYELVRPFTSSGGLNKA